ncbi:MAG: hypothetical protein KDN18_02355 [Verrucomicrobiae bacterium]|nr:hypothetical protein [Verrucomicrobiae bacterium]
MPLLRHLAGPEVRIGPLFRIHAAAFEDELHRRFRPHPSLRSEGIVPADLWMIDPLALLLRS